VSPEPIVLADDQALVAGTELIPVDPVVLPFADAGAIAAAHALVDIYAAGATLVTATPLVIGPDSLDEDDFAELWRAIGEVVLAAGGELGEGRLLQGASEVLAGASVVGLVDPSDGLPRSGAGPGDVLVLSKPIGTTSVLAAGNDKERSGAIDGMRLTNRIAAERLLELAGDCHGVVGVKEAGLMGDARDLAERSGVAAVIDSSLVPCYRGAKPAAGDDVAALVAAPEVSGGLLAAVHPAAIDQLVDAGFRPIGAVEEAAPDAAGVVRLV
jgi:selenide,water dikinase